MTISEQQRADLTNQVNASELAPAAKERILALLAAPDVSEESLAEIRSVIQADIDADIAAVAPGFDAEMANDPEEKAILADGEAQMKAVADDLDDSMKFVAEQSEKIEQAAAQLSAALDKNNLDDVKSRLGMTPGAGQ